MKRFGTLLIVAVIASFLVTAPALAERREGMMGGAMMKERQQMMQDMMEMLKEAMGILKELNHAPTAEQKKDLTR